MIIVVDPHSGVPVYKQLMDQVKFHVASGLLKPGDELPSTRALSSQLGVNPMTISKAYGYLERDGVIERRPGRPLVVRELEEEQVRRRRLDQLRRSIASVITMIRQLGIAKDDALRIFGEMLENSDRTPEPEGGAENVASGDNRGADPRGGSPEQGSGERRAPDDGPAGSRVGERRAPDDEEENK
jgi:GntR family transcriptional regulator